MQDRFKFRVWCKNKKEWEKDEIMITNNGKYIVTSSDIKKPFLITEADPIHHEINFCTGLKDKNGNLIYESDIVSDGYDKYVVEWCEYNVQFEFRDLSEEFKVVYTIEQLLPLEVVGNVYENGELLKCQKK